MRRKRASARPAEALAAYPDLERQNFDETLEQAAAAAALRPMPVVVLTASDKFIDVVPKLIQAGELPPDTPPDLGAVVDRANSAAQNELATLVPGAGPIAAASPPAPATAPATSPAPTAPLGQATERHWRDRPAGETPQGRALLAQLAAQREAKRKRAAREAGLGKG